MLPPEDVAARQARAQDPHILKALGRAWSWRRKLESGELATVNDLANAEKITDRFVSRTMRLAYLSPEVLERLVVGLEPPTAAWNDLVKAASTPWCEQRKLTLGY